MSPAWSKFIHAQLRAKIKCDCQKNAEQSRFACKRFAFTAYDIWKHIHARIAMKLVALGRSRVVFVCKWHESTETTYLCRCADVSMCCGVRDSVHCTMSIRLIRFIQSLTKRTRSVTNTHQPTRDKCE